MKRKELTIADRVDILLREGTENPKKWAKVHGYSEPSRYDMYDDDGVFIESCFDTLREHHLEETTFLFEVINELRRRLVDK